MADFSSCYFCGAALDAPLEEYPVVPAELHPSPEQQGTVVLCPTCREKLGAIVGEVIDAVETDASLVGRRTTDATLDAATRETTPADATTERSTPAESATDGTTAPDDATAATVDLDEKPTDDEADGSPADAVNEPAPNDPAETEAEPPTTGPETDDPETDHPTTDGDDGPPTKRTTAAGESDRERSPIFDDDSTVEDDESDPYGPVFQPDEDEATTAGGADGAADETADDGGASADDRERADESNTAMPDARTYNRVVRLLQNRDFPVDRDEIEAVATNAYELSTAEFDAVIRVAVDRGVLVEDDGTLDVPGGE